MSSTPKRLIPDPQALENKLKEIVRRIHDDEDPHLMNMYRRFFKRNVSIFSRNYVVAYLIKQLAEGDLASDVPSNGEREPEDNETADTRTLFVSVGKNRRVFPRDIAALFADIEGVDAAQIGPIKVLDNYSFVEVDRAVSDAVIAAMNGKDFRGRKLTVNYARTK